jgi:hypothetical protein
MKLTLNRYSTNKKTTLVFDYVQFGIMPKFFIVFASALFFVNAASGQPYHPTYVENRKVKQNSNFFTSEDTEKLLANCHHSIKCI